MRKPKLPPPGPPVCVWCGRRFDSEAELEAHERDERAAFGQEHAEAVALTDDWRQEQLELLAAEVEGEGAGATPAGNQ